MLMTPGLFLKGHALPNRFAVIDLGTSETRCFIASQEGTQEPCLRGYASIPSGSFKRSVMENIHDLHRELKMALESAEKKAQMRVRESFLLVSALRTYSTVINVSLPLSGATVTQEHVERLSHRAIQVSKVEGQSVVHLLPLDFSLDEHMGLRSPMGGRGDWLGGSFHLVSLSQTMIYNILECMRCLNVEVSAVLHASYCSSLASLPENVSDHPTVFIDMGSATTTAVIWKGGQCVGIETVPLGCGDATTDVMQGLNLSFDTAEYVKHMYGAPEKKQGSGYSLFHRGDGLKGAVVNKALEHMSPKEALIHILTLRYEEMITLLQKRLWRRGFKHLNKFQYVLSGGGSLFPGVSAMVEKAFDARAWATPLLRPHRCVRQMMDTRFSACAGALVHMHKVAEERMESSSWETQSLVRFARWMKEAV